MRPAAAPTVADRTRRATVHARLHRARSWPPLLRPRALSTLAPPSGAQGGTETPHGDETLRPATGPEGAADPYQPAYQGPRGPRDRERRRDARRPPDARGAPPGPGAGARSRRGQPQGRAAGLQDPRLRQVQVRRKEEGHRGEAQAERRRDQGDQAPSQDGRSRSRVQDARGEPVPRGRAQGQVHRALPWSRDHAPGEGAGAARLDRAAVRGHRQRRGAPRHGAAHDDAVDGAEAGRDAEGRAGSRRRREGPSEGHPRGSCRREEDARGARARGHREDRAGARRSRWGR